MADTVTYTSSPMTGGPVAATGTVTDVAGTAAINVVCGFKPTAVQLVINGSNVERVVFWWDSMGSSVTGLLASTPAFAIAAGGISQYVGDGDNAQGFTIGSGLQTAADTIYWIAWP